MSDWWWHLWHDPMRDNLWTWPVMVLVLVAGMVGLHYLNRLMDTLRDRWQNRTRWRKASTIPGPGRELIGNFRDAASTRAGRRRRR